MSEIFTTKGRTLKTKRREKNWISGKIRGVCSQPSSPTYTKYSHTPSGIRQQSSSASHALVLIMLPLWSPVIVHGSEHYISNAYVHSCSCGVPRCLWMVGPHRHSCGWSLSQLRSNRVRCQRSHTHASKCPVLCSQEDFMTLSLGGFFSLR